MYVLNPELMAQMDDDHNVTVKSDAFSGPVKLKPAGKVSWKGQATIRCDATPGAHAIGFAEPVPPERAKANGKVTVEGGGSATGTECAATGSEGGPSATTITVTAVAAAVATAGAFIVVRRRRRSGLGHSPSNRR
ncbi:hypothetical protein ADL21_02310 [Streptomyces albus subsp. albus]|nr:hypothetical protein ADL21_02310 [Streptomyces albus subsp. albus]